MHLEPEQTPLLIFYPVRLSVCLSELFLSFSLSLSHKTPPGNESREIFTFLPLNGIGTDAEGAKCGSGDWDRGETDTDEARNLLSK